MGQAELLHSFFLVFGASSPVLYSEVLLFSRWFLSGREGLSLQPLSPASFMAGAVFSLSEIVPSLLSSIPMRIGLAFLDLFLNAFGLVGC